MPVEMINTTSHPVNPLIPLLIYFVLSAALVALLLLAAHWLGGKREQRNKPIAYESGILPTGSARFGYQAPFYLIAIFFIVFDVEAVFIFTWGVAWQELGWPGLLLITYFIIVLLIGLLWLWKKGGLDWGPSRAGQSKERQA